MDAVEGSVSVSSGDSVSPASPFSSGSISCSVLSSSPSAFDSEVSLEAAFCSEYVRNQNKILG